MTTPSDPEQTEMFEYDERGLPKPRRNLIPTIFPGKPAPGVRKSATSMAAAKLMDGKRAPLLAQIYNLLLGLLPDGLTDEEGQEMLSLAGNTYRPRRGELEEAGLVKNSLLTRPTRAKRQAVVWIAVPIEDLA
jgi:hypothetical protein